MDRLRPAGQSGLVGATSWEQLNFKGRMMGNKVQSANSRKSASYVEEDESFCSMQCLPRSSADFENSFSESARSSEVLWVGVGSVKG